MYTKEKFNRAKRRFYPENLKVTRWRTIKKEFLALLEMPIKNTLDLELLIHKSGEGIKILLDYRNKLFIEMKSKTTIFNYLKFLLFQKRILSKGLDYNYRWENKIAQSTFKDALDKDLYGHFLKLIAHQQQMYEPKNTKLITNEEHFGNQYNLFISRLGGKFEGDYYTLPALERKLLDKNRDTRKLAFHTIAQAFLSKNRKLQNLFEKLLKIRQSIAINAGYKNFRDYAHIAKGRFSYSIEDVIQFHHVVEKEVVPVLQSLNQKIAKSQNLKEFKPWDAKIENNISLSPYKNKNDLMEKCAMTMNAIKPEYGVYFRKMVNSDLLDVFNRKKKSPGAYNIPLFEMGASFIFANFIEEKATHQDIAILHHEFGHALHNYFVNDMPIMSYKNFPSEISELAAMTMELITIEHLHFYYVDEESQKEAKKQQLRRFLQLIVSRCQGDLYQHWIYSHPDHSEAERNRAFIESMNRFSDGVSWKGEEEYQHLESLKVLHYFQVPFYYIEYAFAALGAIDIYRSYKTSPHQTLHRYESFLKSGYNQDVHLLYKIAGTSFPFSDTKVRELMEFVKKEFVI